MAEFTIYLANKNYSSWSLRGWLMLKLSGAAFAEVVIPLRQEATRDSILRRTPAGKLPTLVHDKPGGPITVWESLAIGEYLAELFPAAGLWPQDPAARAHARAISNEMHAGFLPLRRHFPMNMRGIFDRESNPEVQEDIERLAAIWRDARRRFGQSSNEKGGGQFLFGSLTIADAMFAPVVSRFRTFKIPLDAEAEAYAKAITAWPAYQEWLAAARAEPWTIEQWEF